MDFFALGVIAYECMLRIIKAILIALTTWIPVENSNYPVEIEMTGFELSQNQDRFSISQLQEGISSAIPIPYHTISTPGTRQQRSMSC